MFTKKEAELIKENFEIQPAKISILDIAGPKNQKQITTRLIIMIKNISSIGLADYAFNELCKKIVAKHFNNELDHILRITVINETINLDYNEIFELDIFNYENDLLECCEYFTKIKNLMFEAVEIILRKLAQFIEMNLIKTKTSYEYNIDFNIDEHTEKNEKYFTIVNPQDMNETKLKVENN